MVLDPKSLGWEQQTEQFLPRRKLKGIVVHREDILLLPPPPPLPPAPPPLPPISPSGVGTALIYRTQTTAGRGFVDVIGATPPSINTPIIFEPEPAFTAGQYKLIFIVTASEANWGGAQVWSSVDNNSYGQIGVVFRGNVQGTLTAPFPTHADPDTVDALSVNVGMSSQQINSASNMEADLHMSMAYVDGELISYTSVTLTAVNQYRLDTYIRRGVYGSTVANHAAGTQFGLVNGGLFSQIYPSNLVGHTIHFKFPSFNLANGNLQDISTLPVYSYVLTGAGVVPVPPIPSLWGFAQTDFPLRQLQSKRRSPVTAETRGIPDLIPPPAPVALERGFEQTTFDLRQLQSKRRAPTTAETRGIPTFIPPLSWRPARVDLELRQPKRKLPLGVESKGQFIKPIVWGFEQDTTALRYKKSKFNTRRKEAIKDADPNFWLSDNPD